LPLGLAPVAQAAPASPAFAPSPAAAEPGTGIIKVHRRGHGVGLGIGIGLGLLGGAVIANEAYRSRRGTYYDDDGYDGPYSYPSGFRGDPRVVCARSFRSFEWGTGLYTTYSGERRLCPYLR
jgi:hypothetical protein